MNILYLIKLGLSVLSIGEIIINFCYPLFYIMKGYKKHLLKNKNIFNNVNHLNQTVYFHLSAFVIAGLCFIITFFTIFKV
ncbi:hypothetical protein OC683_02140 ['Crotalaria aegyptiaca' phytoplasma]|uniref:Uncharacterized protein n=1 Tax=Candidatus Phytoplasma crotalariae TaxID=2982627 RepID=A0ABT9D2X7_9MOLU|nr:hypothetical protein ['Crotalaria aegyptiaca' phytoplasma]MDO8059395.1 hypothetical protein ['Crotalaria aegyptiaca' phytoplasma]